MFPRSCPTHPRSLATTRVLPAALIALIFAAALLAFAPSTRAAEDDDEPIRVSLGGGSLVESLAEPTPTEAPTRYVQVLDPAPTDDQAADDTEADDPPLFVTPRVIDEVLDPDVRTDDEAGAYVTINKHLCVGGAELYGSGRDELESACAESLSGVEFTFADLNGAGFQAPNFEATDIDGLAFHMPTVAGPVAIVEEIPFGFGQPIVYCTTVIGIGDPLIQSFDQYQVADGRIDLSVEADAQVYCDWYNVPTPTGEVQIVVVKHECQFGFDAYTSDPDGLAAACGELVDGVSFAASDLGVTDQARTSGDDGAGTVHFVGLDSGKYVVTEEVPAGYGTPVVWCGIGTPENPEPEDYVRYELYGDQPAVFEVLTGDSVLSCHWFNVPNDENEGGTVTVVKHVCPAGFDPGDLPIYEYDPGCEAILADVPFHLTISGLYEDQQTTDDQGRAVWADVPAGALSLDEQIPDGYGEPTVFCSTDGYNGTPVKTVVDGSEIVLDYDGGDLVCWWINFPTTDDGDVTVFKWDCPAYLPVDPYLADLDQLQSECATPANGVTFDLYQASLDATESRITGDGVEEGVAFWDNVAAGQVTVTEQLPAGYDTPVVWCDVYNPAAQDQPDFDHYEDVELEAGANLTPGQSLMCYWFNIPTDTDGTIEVVKYWCDGYLYDPASCEIYTGGQAFALSAPGGGDPVFFETGPDGRYEVKAGPGTWFLIEGDGGWCYADSDNETQTQPQPNPGFEGTILYVEVEAGQTTTIEVFNCDPWTQDDPGDDPGDGGDDGDNEDDESGPVVVTSLPDTGAGIRADTDRLSRIAAVQLGLVLLFAAVAVRRRARR